jgi:hypothetical protein
MSTTATVFHIRDKRPEEVADALGAIFASEERDRVLRVQGTYSAILRRVADEELVATYRYVVGSPHFPSPWTPVFEIGTRTAGLDVELSRALGGSPVVTIFVYGDVVSGYTVVRDGVVADRYVSDPDALAEDTEDRPEPDDLRGHPERVRDLLPEGTDPGDFWRIVLQPGWWEAHAAHPKTEAVGNLDSAENEEDVVDEVDRMRCIGLAFELWAPDDYPFAAEPEEIPNVAAGPAIGLAFA